MPTINFLIYLLFIAGAYVFRIGYNGWFGPYLLSAVIAVPLFLLLLSLPSMLSATAELSCPGKIKRGEKSYMYLRLKSRGLLSLRHAKVSVSIHRPYSSQTEKHTLSLKQLSANGTAIQLPTDNCGMIICSLDRFICRDMLGLISISKKVSGRCSCFVQPTPVPPVSEPNIDASLDKYLELKPKPGGGYAEDYELREYVPGDPVNNIHWKISSKIDKLVLRDSLFPQNDGIYLVLADCEDKDRTLECAYWLSLLLVSKELKHIIVSGSMYEVGNENDSIEAMCEILSVPAQPPCAVDEDSARAVFTVKGEEVMVQ